MKPGLGETEIMLDGDVRELRRLAASIESFCRERGLGDDVAFDLNLALEGARTLGLSLPSTALAQQLFSSCAAHGGKAWDHSGMVRALEMMAQHQVAQG